MAVDTSIIGKETGRARVQVERAPLANFAKAVKDENPVYHDAERGQGRGLRRHPRAADLRLRAWSSGAAYAELQHGPAGRSKATPCSRSSAS